MAEILVGRSLVERIDKLKFAFESAMSLWVRKNGILISHYFATSYPALGSLFFRVCIQYAEDKDRAEWISALLKPWATVIHLMPNNPSCAIPEYVNRYNAAVIEQQQTLQLQQQQQSFRTAMSTPIGYGNAMGFSGGLTPSQSGSYTVGYAAGDDYKYDVNPPPSKASAAPMMSAMGSRRTVDYPVALLSNTSSSQSNHQYSNSLSDRNMPSNTNSNGNNGGNAPNSNPNMNQKQRSRSSHNSPRASHEPSYGRASSADPVASGNPNQNQKDIESKSVPFQQCQPEIERITHQFTKHETFALLSRIFDSTVEAKDDSQTSFLKVWTDLSQAFPYENLHAILDFVLEKVQQAKELQSPEYKTVTLPTVKNIFFAIYEPPLNRAVMTVYIVRIILRILKIGSAEYREDTILVKQRAAEILTTLEQRLTRDANNDNMGGVGLHYDIHHEILDQKAMAPKVSSSVSVPANASVPSMSSNSRSKKAQFANNSRSKPRYRATDAITVKYPLNGMYPRPRSNYSVSEHRLREQSNSGKGKLLTTEEKRASVAASLLVELIGVDCEPIKPYFPVLVLYAALYIDKPSNHNSMHNLLVRLMVTLSTQKTIQEIEKGTHLIDDNKPTLSLALASRTLELLWDEDVDGSASSKQFVHNQGDFVAMDGATFVKEYCSQFTSIYAPGRRTGYEALRWAVLSTNPELTTRSFHIYRQLLDPLDHCTVKVMLLALCGAIDDWKASESEASGSISGARSPSIGPKKSYHSSAHSVDIRMANSGEFRETMRILDTLIKMAEKLKNDAQIWRYDSFIWTGIALLRADVKIEQQKQVYRKGLELLNIVLDDDDINSHYLFINSHSVARQQALFADDGDDFNQMMAKRQSKNSVEFQKPFSLSGKTPMGGGRPSPHQQSSPRFDANSYPKQTPFGSGTAGGPSSVGGGNGQRLRFSNNGSTYESKQQHYGGGDAYGTYGAAGNDYEAKQPYGSVTTKGGPNGGWNGNDLAQHQQSPQLQSASAYDSNAADWQYEFEYDYEPSASRSDYQPWGDTIGAPLIGHTPFEPDMAMDSSGTVLDEMNQTSGGRREMSERHAHFADDGRRGGGPAPGGYVNYNDLDEQFLAYCIDWDPLFQGIHPYLLQGLLQKEIEDQTFRVLKKVMTTKMDKLAARHSDRPCLCVVAVLPYLHYIVRHKPEYFATVSHSLFEALKVLTAGGSLKENPYHALQSKIAFWSNQPIHIENVQHLLRDFCSVLVSTFFAEHSGMVAFYLNSLLNASAMAHHHTTVYRMAALFLKEDANYIHAFNDIIVSAHKAVSEKGNYLSNNANLRALLRTGSNDPNLDSASEMADAATELVAESIDYLKLRGSQSFTKNYSHNDFEATAGGPLGAGPSGMGSTDHRSQRRKETTIRFDVEINYSSPFPVTGLRYVSNALWGVVHATKSIVP